MPIISVEILKIKDEIKRCDTKCVVMRWSSSEVVKCNQDIKRCQ